jgi:hypothetical protein
MDLEETYINTRIWVDSAQGRESPCECRGTGRVELYQVNNTGVSIYRLREAADM